MFLFFMAISIGIYLLDYLSHRLKIREYINTKSKLVRTSKTSYQTNSLICYLIELARGNIDLTLNKMRLLLVESIRNNLMWKKQREACNIIISISKSLVALHLYSRSNAILSAVLSSLGAKPIIRYTNNLDIGIIIEYLSKTNYSNTVASRPSACQPIWGAKLLHNIFSYHLVLAILFTINCSATDLRECSQNE